MAATGRQPPIKCSDCGSRWPTRAAGVGWSCCWTALLDADFELGGEQLQRIPKPWDVEHPRHALLRHKSLTASRSFGQPEWLHSAAALEQVAGAWRALQPLNAWLARHVGPHRDVRQD